jgi:hypothetical protein
MRVLAGRVQIEWYVVVTPHAPRRLSSSWMANSTGKSVRGRGSISFSPGR